jgi:hypothetical protein
VADYLNYEQQFRAQRNLTDFKSMPLGFLDFAALWNDGIPAGDSRQLSHFWYSDESNEPTIVISTTPVNSDDFFIGPEQVGLGAPPPVPQPEPVRDPLHDDIMKEFAVVVMEQRRLKRELEGLSTTSPPAQNGTPNRSNVPNRHCAPTHHHAPNHNRVHNQPKPGNSHNHRQDTSSPRGEKRRRDFEPAPFGQREAPKNAISRLQFKARPSRRQNNKHFESSVSSVSTASSSQTTLDSTSSEHPSLPELESIQDVTMQGPISTTEGGLPIEEIVRVA